MLWHVKAQYKKDIRSNISNTDHTLSKNTKILYANTKFTKRLKSKWNLIVCIRHMPQIKLYIQILIQVTSCQWEPLITVVAVLVGC